MNNEGWSWGDLLGELMERGIDPDEVSDNELFKVLSAPTPELAAETIRREEQGCP